MLWPDPHLVGGVGRHRRGGTADRTSPRPRPQASRPAPSRTAPAAASAIAPRRRGRWRWPGPAGIGGWWRPRPGPRPVNGPTRRSGRPYPRPRHLAARRGGPDIPPIAARPIRTDAPELVPGSTKASSLNSASGETAEISIIITAGRAVPIASLVWSACPPATPDAIWTPTPMMRVITTGVNAAAWNQRSDFQNHARPVSPTRPAAEIGVVAASTTSAPARVSNTTKCAIAATTQQHSQQAQDAGGHHLGDVVDLEVRPADPSPPASRSRTASASTPR